MGAGEAWATDMLETNSKCSKSCKKLFMVSEFHGYSFEWLGQPSLAELGDQEDYLVRTVLIRSVLGKSYL